MLMDDKKITFKVIETNKASSHPFEAGQFIIQDDGVIFYDPTYGDTNITGTDISSRIRITKDENVHSNKGDDTKSDSYYLNLVTTNAEINKNDICAIYRLIPHTTDKYEYITYACSGFDTNSQPIWTKIVDKYSRADNTYITEDIKATIELDGFSMENGITTLPTKGQDLTSALKAILGPTKYPTITEPSLKFENVYLSTGTNNTSQTSFEVGTSVTPTYILKWDKGKYTFGPDTKVTINKLTVSDTLGRNDVETGDNTNSLLNAVCTLPNFVVEANMNYKITATAEHTAGAWPYIVPSQEPYDERIEAGIVTAPVLKTFTSYIAGYYFGTSESVIEGNSLTSAIIKGLKTKSTQNYKAGNFNGIVPAKTKTIIIAAPKAYTGMTKVVNTTVNADMTSTFKGPYVVKVAGADGVPTSKYATEYNVWLYHPAQAYNNQANLTITLG